MQPTKLCSVFFPGWEKQDFNGAKQKNLPLSERFLIVGVARFELTTSCSQSRRDTGLRYTPLCASSIFESANIRLFYLLQKKCSFFLKMFNLL